MLVVVLYWLVVSWLFYMYGDQARRWLGCSSLSFFEHFCLGAVTISVIASVFAFFGGLGLYFELGVLGVGMALSLFRYSEIKERGVWTLRDLRGLSKKHILVLAAILGLSLVAASAAPFLMDNEYYYLPVIHWLDSHGFVPGIANLNGFYGQQSGWHILQAGLNIDALTHRINDLNGLFLFWMSVWALRQPSVKDRFFASVFLFGLPFVIHFSSSPSTDLPVWILTWYLLIQWRKDDGSGSRMVLYFVLSFFAVYIKLTALPLVMIPLSMSLYQHRLLKYWRRVVLLGSLFLSLFLVKNAVVTGYLWYPLPVGALPVDWVMPKDLMQYQIEMSTWFGFGLTAIEVEAMSVFELGVHWLKMPGIYGKANAIMALLLLVAVVFSFCWSRKKTLITLFCVIQLSFLFIVCPQYRFYLPLVFILLAIVGDEVLSLSLKKRTLKWALPLFISAGFIPFFVSFQVNDFNQSNQQAISESKWQAEELLLPHENTSMPMMRYTEKERQGMIYHEPDHVHPFVIGDAPLLTARTAWLTYVEEQFGWCLQQRGERVSSGFYWRSCVD